MEKALSVLDTIIDSIKRLQDRILKLENQKKYFVTKDDLKDFKTKLDVHIKRLHDKLKQLEKEFKNIQSSTESKFYNIENKLKAIESKITNLVSMEDFSKVNIEIFNINTELENLKTSLSELENRFKELQKTSNKILELVKKLNELENSVKKLEKTIDPAYIEEKLSSLNLTVETISKHLNELNKEYEDLSTKVGDIENNVIKSVIDELSSLKEFVDEQIKSVKDEIEELQYLKDISCHDIEKIKKLIDVESVNKRLMEIEGRVNTLNTLINDLGKVLYTVRSKISKVNLERDKLLAMENSINRLEKEYNKILEEISSLKEEMKDIKDITLISAKETDKLSQKILQLETKIKIENIEEVLDAFERIKLLEEDIRQIKQILARYHFPMESEKELAMKVRQLENAIKRLYEQQNSLLYSLNEKLEKLEKMVNK